jgi:hypothetical protein
MSHENLSGRIYKFKLDFNLGIAFMQLIDFTYLDVFDGKLVIVFNQFSNDDFNIYDKSIFLGPLVVNKFPPLKGNRKFVYVCNTDVEIKSFYIKNLQGLLWENDDWSIGLNYLHGILIIFIIQMREQKM